MSYLITLIIGIAIGFAVGTGNLSINADVPDPAEVACSQALGVYIDNECRNPNDPALQP